MPRFHPRPGKGGIVDQANVLEPAQHLVRSLVRDAALAQRVGELGAGPWREREQPQAHLPCPLPRIVSGTAGPALAVFHKGGFLVLVSRRPAGLSARMSSRPYFQPAAPA